MGKDLHEVQASILRELLFNNGANFAALNKSGLTNDHFTFHLKRLLAEKIVEKKGRNYFLTELGKIFAGKLDIDNLVIEKQGAVGVAVTAKKLINGVSHFLVQERLKQPFYKYYGFINGKIRFGDTSLETAKRELFEETGLTGTPRILCVYHKIRGPKRDEIKLDHFFFVYLVDNPKGKLKDTKEGKNSWKTAEEIRKLKTFPGFESALKIVESGVYTPYFEEYVKLDNI